MHTPEIFHGDLLCTEILGFFHLHHVGLLFLERCGRIFFPLFLLDIKDLGLLFL